MEIVTDALTVAVTFHPERGYVGTHPELRTSVTALSLGGLCRKVEALMMPNEVIVTLKLDKAASWSGTAVASPVGRVRALPEGPTARAA